MKRWISVLLTLTLIFALAPERLAPVLAEEGNEVVGGSVDALVPPAQSVDADGLVVETGEWESVDGAESPGDAPAQPDGVPAQAPAAARYVWVTAERAAVADAEGNAFAALPAGSGVLVVGESGAWIEVAFNTERGVVTGRVAAADLAVMADEEAAAFVDALVSGGAVALYDDNLNTPLAMAACEFIESNDDPTDPTNPIGLMAAPGDIAAVAAPLFTLRDVQDGQIELPVGSTFALSAVAMDDMDIEAVDLGFVSEDEAVATVSEAGVITAQAPGETRVTVAYLGQAQTVTVRVPEEPTQLILTAGSISLGQSEVYSRLAVARMEPEGSASTITWSTSNKRYVAVNAKTGAIKGVKRGSAYIYARARNGVWARCKVTVKKKPSKITLPKSYAVGLGLPANRLGVKLSSGAASANLSWSSSNPAIVSVDPVTGALTPLAEGAVRITARTYNGKSGSCTVYVRPLPTDVALRPAANVSVNSAITLKPVMTPSSAIAANTYTSLNPEVATVDNTGRVVGRSLGTAIITTTTYNGITSPVDNSCVVTVYNAPTKVWLNTGYITLGVGATYALVPSVPEGCNPDVSWATSKSRYATVNGNGVVTAKKKGTAKITVRTTNGKTAACTVKVVAAPKSVSVSPRALTLCEGGMTYQLKAGISPGGTRAAITYTSSDPEVVEVNPTTGLITTGRPGAAVITVATHNGKRAYCAVAVKPEPASMSFGNNGMLTVNSYSAFPLPALSMQDVNGSGDVYAQVSYAVDPTRGDPSCISVNASNGQVTPRATEGTAYVTATTHNGVTATCTVDVDINLIEAVIGKARSQLGKPYIYGAGYKDANPRGFDCSGFTHWSYYYGAGVTLGSSAYSQGHDSGRIKITDMNELRRGDIVCFFSKNSNGSNTTYIGHVGIYLGNMEFIHASSGGKKVQINKLTENYYSNKNYKSSQYGYTKGVFAWGYHVL